MRFLAALIPAFFLIACNAAPPATTTPRGVPEALQSAALAYEEAQISGDATTLGAPHRRRLRARRQRRRALKQS